MLGLAWFLIVFLFVITGEWNLAWHFGWPFFTIMIPCMILMFCLENKWRRESIGVTSFSEAKEKANDIVNKLRWEHAGSAQTDFPYYVCQRYKCTNVADFDWLVKYITVKGGKDKYGKSSVLLKESMYTCNSVNRDYTVTQILREPYSQEEIDRIEQRIAAYKAIQEQEKAIESNYVPFTQENLVQTAKALAQEFNIGQCPDSHADINLSEYKNMKKKMWDALNRGRVSLSKLGEFEELLDEYDELLDGVDEEISDLRDEIDDRRWNIEQLIS